MSRSTGERWLGPLLFVGLLPLVWFFFEQEGRTDGFAQLHQYGFTPDGRNWAQLLPPDEGRLYLSMLVLLPVALATGVWASTSRVTTRVLALLRRRENAIMVGAAGLAMLLALAMSHLTLDRTPITDDEGAYLFHARVVAGGELAHPSEREPDRFFYNAVFIINDGKMISQYPVGHPVMLAAGVLLGDPWLVPALLCGLVTLLLGLSSRELFGPGCGSGTALCCAASPFLVASSGTLLAHVTCLFWLALFLYAALRATRLPGRPGWMVLAAVAFGCAVITRPVSSVMVGAPLWLIPLWRARPLERRRLLALLFVGVGGVMLSLQLALNQYCNGDPFRAAYFNYWLEHGQWRNPFGFGEFILDIVHTPAIAWGNQLHNAVRLNAWLLGWPLSLMLPLWAVLSCRHRRRPAVVLLVAACLPLVLYFFFFWPGVADVGPVLYTESLAGWLILCGAAFGTGSLARRRFVVGLFVAATLLSAVTFHRIQLRSLGEVAEQASRVPDLVEQRLAEDGVVEPVLVFCHFLEFPEVQHSWVLGHPPPWPDLRDDVLYVTSSNPQENRSFARRKHPQRVPYKLYRDARGELILTPLERAP